LAGAVTYWAEDGASGGHAYFSTFDLALILRMALPKPTFQIFIPMKQ